MATVKKPDDETTDEGASPNAGSTLQAGSGSSIGSGGGGVGINSSPAARGGTGFTNISDYLKENSGGATNATNKSLEDYFGKKESDLESSTSDAANKAISDIDARNYDLTPDQIWKWRQLNALNTRNLGPGMELAPSLPWLYKNQNPNSDITGSLTPDYNSFQNEANRLNTSSGTTGLLTQLNPGHYGQNALDSALLLGSGGNSSIRGKYSNLNDFLTQQQNSVNSARDARAANNMEINRQFTPEEKQYLKSKGLLGAND